MQKWTVSFFHLHLLLTREGITTYWHFAESHIEKKKTFCCMTAGPFLASEFLGANYYFQKKVLLEFLLLKMLFLLSLVI